MTKKEIEQEMKKYEEVKYTESQMEEIREGLKSGINVSIYADPKFNDEQMGVIRYALENGLNDVEIKKYIDPKFDKSQMYELFLGLEADINVSTYADPKLSWKEMDIIRKNLKREKTGIKNLR